ncbi:MAG: hypothetical protein JSV83_05620 [Desulfobacterales bacterium]|nr:MAG: hypothetical protein JSV83_05620 [Desulfobacterales bacterium]
MNYTLAKRLFIGLTIGFFMVGCTAKKIEVEYEKDGNSGYSVVDHKKGGPPPHAPAHGYRAKHQYRYYPSRSVYYDTGRGLYFYLRGSNWEVGASLPSNLRVGLGDYVSMELDTDKPYIHYAEHVKKYPPGQMKNKYKKNKWG